MAFNISVILLDMSIIVGVTFSVDGIKKSVGSPSEPVELGNELPLLVWEGILLVLMPVLLQPGRHISRSIIRLIVT